MSFTGYPDWQHVENWDSPILWADSTPTAFDQQAVSPALDVRRYKSLAIACAPTSPVTVTVNWFTDQTLRTRVGIRTMVLSAGNIVPFQGSLVNLGPWARVFVAPNGVAWTPNVNVWGSNREAGSEGIVTLPIIRQQIGSALIARGIQDLPCIGYAEGLMQFWAKADTSNVVARVQAASSLTVWNTIWEGVLTANVGLAAQIVAPLTGLQVEIDNSANAAPITYSLSLAPAG